MTDAATGAIAGDSLRSRWTTALDFGDPIGIGHTFGEGRRNEVLLRGEHFPNGGRKQPNPGKNFIELRFSRHSN